MAAHRTGVVWIDAQGERVLHVLTTTTGGLTLLSDIKAKSNADQSFNWDAAENVISPAPVVATYPTVRVTAQLLFTDATGSIAKLYIPAPVSSIFLSDGVTVDPAQVATIISDAIGTLLAGSGLPVTMFLGGQLWQQRINALGSLQVFTP